METCIVCAQRSTVCFPQRRGKLLKSVPSGVSLIYNELQRRLEMQPVSLDIRVALAALLALAFGQRVSSNVVGHHRCEPLTIPLCASLGYNMTVTPNHLGQPQEDAALESYHFYPLIAIKCSPDMQSFVCSVYAPACPILQDYPIPPCRSVCLSAREGCEPIMMKFGFNWPEHFDCDKFPEVGASEQCVSGNATERLINETSQSPAV